MAIIEVKDLHKSFDKKIALDGIDFSIQSGQIFGFLGPSGSGKTTTINILTNQEVADSGLVEVLGKKGHLLTSSDMKKIGIMSDTVGFFERLTLYDNLLFFSKYHGRTEQELSELLETVGLMDAKGTRAEKLSTGMKQRMLLVRAMIHHPKILFLDEPTSGLDPNLSLRVHKLIKQLKEEGTTIFLTTHDMSEATKLCDSIALLYEGKIIEFGSPEAIIERHSEADKVKLTFNNGNVKIVDKDTIQDYSFSDISKIQSLEVTLEEIFLEMTGAKLDV